MASEFLKDELMSEEEIENVAGGKSGTDNLDIPFGGDGVFISFPFQNAEKADWRPPGKF